MSASAVRIQANQENAQLSTGPRTEDGKARSSQNARKHGLTAAQVLIAAEDRAQFEELHSNLETEINPQGTIQRIVFDELVAAAWGLRRIRRMEAQLNASAESDLDLLDNDDVSRKLDRLARHHTRIERTFHRALRELKALQTDAALAPTLPYQFNELNVPLASKAAIAKRTQHMTANDRRSGHNPLWSTVDEEQATMKIVFEPCVD